MFKEQQAYPYAWFKSYDDYGLYDFSSTYYFADKLSFTQWMFTLPLATEILDKHSLNINLSFVHWF